MTVRDLRVAKVFTLWIKGDHRLSEQRFTGILALSGLTLATGVGGILFDVYSLFSVLERTPDLAGILVPEWMVREAALLSVSILLAVAGALAWFLLTHRVALLSDDRRAVLGLDHD